MSGFDKVPRLVVGAVWVAPDFMGAIAFLVGNDRIGGRQAQLALHLRPCHPAPDARSPRCVFLCQLQVESGFGPLLSYVCARSAFTRLWPLKGFKSEWSTIVML